MENTIRYISKIEIQGLWERFDLKWELQPDVNVLSGINGSGKSTILRSIAYSLNMREDNDILTPQLLNHIRISFNDNSEIDHIYLKINKTIESIKEESKNNKSFEYLFKEIENREGPNYNPSKVIQGLGFTIVTNDIFQNTKINNILNVNIINTFDNDILEIGKPDEIVKTELDRDIFYLQKKYLDYQLNISKKVIEAVNNNNNAQEEVQKIQHYWQRFKEIIDNLFEETGKKINPNENEIIFLNGDKELTAYDLSSGEKQMLVILLTTLVQDTKPSIILMDEPEISLHFDWQKKLIQYIRELNPNAQIILATHSPAVIMEGWTDKVKNVKDLIVHDNLAIQTDASDNTIR